ncbi:MAG: hypothetical protein LBI98_03260 [Endomicrobium sp.]|nr:hypothetical protein [Endomicrobium sp.]
MEFYVLDEKIGAFQALGSLTSSDYKWQTNTKDLYSKVEKFAMKKDNKESLSHPCFIKLMLLILQ